MLWTVLGRSTDPRWHRAKVVRQLEADRTDGFTHDAVFTAERRPYPRGVTLSVDTFNEGCWVLLEPFLLYPSCQFCQQSARSNA
eukprot:4082447-Pleurochrysis_carterae.AAC.1